MKLNELYLSPFWIRFVFACLAALAVLKLGTEFYRLVWEIGRPGAIDLGLRYREVQIWFSGEPLYGQISHATYPPATMVTLWPLIGWSSFQSVRWFWAILSIASLIWLVWLLFRECECRSLTERIFIALIPLSMNATGIAIGNGQFSVLFLPLLICILALGRSGAHSPQALLAVTVMFLLALVKPTFTAPFLLVLLFVYPGFRIAAAIVFIYILLTLIASIFQEPGVITLMTEWFSVARAESMDAAVRLDYGSVHFWLAGVNLSQWGSVASILLLSAICVWIYFFRRVDLWVIFGVTAVIARMWTYHGIYDDMLIIIPIIAVYRHVKSTYGDSPPDLAVQLLLAGSIFVMLIPARLFYFWPAPWPILYAVSHLFFWFWLLYYLLSAAHRENLSMLAKTN